MLNPRITICLLRSCITTLWLVSSRIILSQLSWLHVLSLGVTLPSVLEPWPSAFATLVSRSAGPFTTFISAVALFWVLFLLALPPSESEDNLSFWFGLELFPSDNLLFWKSFSISLSMSTGVGRSNAFMPFSWLSDFESSSETWKEEWICCKITYKGCICSHQYLVHLLVKQETA